MLIALDFLCLDLFLRAIIYMDDLLAIIGL